MEFKLLIEECELNCGVLADVYFNEREKIYRVNEINGEFIKYYKPTKHPYNLNEKEEREILTYTLGKNYPMDERVEYRDIFLHFEHIEKIG